MSRLSVSKIKEIIAEKGSVFSVLVEVPNGIFGLPLEQQHSIVTNKVFGREWPVVNSIILHKFKDAKNYIVVATFFVEDEVLALMEQFELDSSEMLEGEGTDESQFDYSSLERETGAAFLAEPLSDTELFDINKKVYEENIESIRSIHDSSSIVDGHEFSYLIEVSFAELVYATKNNLETFLESRIVNNDLCEIFAFEIEDQDAVGYNPHTGEIILQVTGVISFEFFR